ncbi:hypothetical protein [Aquibacillus albus]|uniref:Uncharacterized protein n=1 Tax=Aquibacillus albus TaxID=1168171 RepID=A0ABS2N2G6_9BACI|nr:hypothetical protein [Aquibacillus albus]MBM7572334.1 hypothetical protein [Aquibacillus albus]
MSILKGIFNGVKKEIMNYSHVAIKTGATNVGKQLANMSSDENHDEKQPSSFQLNNVPDALKTGIMETGQELIKIGRERLETGFQQQQNSEMSDTKKSTEEK